MFITADSCWQNALTTLQFCVTACQTGRAEIWMQCVWNHWLVLFITFKAVTLAAILTSRCSLHNSGKWRHNVLLKWPRYCLSAERALQIDTNTCVFRRVRQLPNLEIPNTRALTSLSKYGATISGGKVELILRDEVAGFDRSFFLVLFRTKT